MRSRGSSEGKEGLGRSRLTVMSGVYREHRRRVDGFTLLEILVVSVLLAVISLATYSALAVGVRIWKRTEVSVQELDVVIGWKKFRKDVVDNFSFRAIGFTGTPQEVSFPGLVTVKVGGGLTREEVGRIRYLFNESGQNLCREEVAYSDLVRGLNSECRPVFSSVGNLSFKYYGRAEGKGSLGSWRPAWDGEKPPIAVRMTIAFKGSEGKGEIEKQYTAVLP